MSGEKTPVPSGQTAFGDRYVLNAKAPLVEFNSHGGLAFEVQDKEKPNVPLYGFVHHPTVPIRNEFYKSLKSRPIANAVNPVDRGLMNVDVKGRKQRLVTIFKRPTGGALLSPDGTLHPELNPNKLRHNVVLSLLKALAELHKRGLVHRYIAPTNMYFAEPGSDEVVLGESYSFPAGYKLPTGLEPLELAFADQSCRGEGDVNADFYQLGASLLCLYFGQDLLKNRSRDSLMMARINQGSYWALAGGQEMPGALGSLTKGLMADALDERWNAEDILDWFEGVGKPKRTTMTTWTMNKPTTFMGVAYVERRLLADAFGRNPLDAAKFLKSIDFPAWTQISLRDEIMTERLEKVINVKPEEGYGGPRSDDHFMVSRVCSFLHPTGPVYYKGMALNISGFPGLIAEYFSRDDRETMTSASEIFDAKILNSLTEIVAERNPNFAVQSVSIKKALDHGPSKQLGRGMERVLYELNPIMPCVSSRFESVWIGSLTQLMRALDRLSSVGGGKNILLDRHVAAFCAAHGTDLEREFNNLAASQSNPAKFNTLTADFFGLLQKRLKLEALPHLCEKLVDGLAPSIRELKNKKRREQVQTAVEKLKKSGDIAKLISDIKLTQTQALDAREFSQATNLVRKLEREKNRLMRKVLPTDIMARKRGYQAARMIAFFGLVTISFFTFFGGR
ncbi:hypothetical protein [Kordiimonas laminariae]|uniref:hypothetical protein n=1 Tax=Kordiimonas laminariae TaxID=2917717 RepID=UPI001FF6E236|nr:hypothetical protein [Kordiimonas laminariae]MCK0068609.1 hypothetical protein [Kordiimonas laminariae]